jgi:hypothetical protein
VANAWLSDPVGTLKRAVVVAFEKLTEYVNKF